MIIGLQEYTIREFLKTQKDMEESFKKVAAIGYRNVELAGAGPLGFKDKRKLLDDCGLKVISSHMGFQAISEETSKTIENMKTLGAKYVVCSWIGAENFNEAGFRKAGDRLAEAAAKLKNAGLVLAYHNHGMELEKFNGHFGLDLILAPEFMSAEIDTYWIQYGGGEPTLWIHKYPGRVPVAHFKDMGIRENKQVMVPVGEGNLNWPGILDACRKAKTEHAIVELDESPTCPVWDAVRISFENMKSWGLKIA
jgi:sugar phosphate isomerase/epimerase